jgi:hypothetical protein
MHDAQEHRDPSRKDVSPPISVVWRKADVKQMHVPRAVIRHALVVKATSCHPPLQRLSDFLEKGQKCL